MIRRDPTDHATEHIKYVLIYECLEGPFGSKN